MSFILSTVLITQASGGKIEFSEELYNHGHYSRNHDCLVPHKQKHQGFYMPWQSCHMFLFDRILLSHHSQFLFSSTEKSALCDFSACATFYFFLFSFFMVKFFFSLDFN